MVSVQIFLETNMEKIVEQYINSILSDLLKNKDELILKPIKIESEWSDYYYKFSVKNEFEIIITFFLNKFKFSDSHHIGVFINSIKMEDDFMLSDWLKYEGYEFEKDPFDFKTYHESDIDIQIKGVIKFLREIFDNKKLKEILEGRFWDETPYDWAGLR
jgi:hypothetical protein